MRRTPSSRTPHKTPRGSCTHPTTIDALVRVSCRLSGLCERRVFARPLLRIQMRLSGGRSVLGAFESDGIGYRSLHIGGLGFAM